MYSTIRFGTASKATPQRRRLYRAGVGFELAVHFTDLFLRRFVPKGWGHDRALHRIDPKFGES